MSPFGLQPLCHTSSHLAHPTLLVFTPTVGRCVQSVCLISSLQHPAHLQYSSLVSDATWCRFFFFLIGVSPVWLACIATGASCPSCVKHKHLKHFSCTATCQCMQLKTIGPISICIPFLGNVRWKSVIQFEKQQQQKTILTYGGGGKKCKKERNKTTPGLLTANLEISPFRSFPFNATISFLFSFGCCCCCCCFFEKTCLYDRTPTNLHKVNTAPNMHSHKW